MLVIRGGDPVWTEVLSLVGSARLLGMGREALARGRCPQWWWVQGWLCISGRNAEDGVVECDPWSETEFGLVTSSVG